MVSTRHDNCESLLAAMVGFDTVNGASSGRPDAERELGVYLDAVARQMGFEARRFDVNEHKFNLVVTHRVADSAPWLMFESHMDTVSVAGMTVDPFAAEIRDGRMYGRGACDTKGTGAAMLWALRDYAANGAGPNNIAVAFSTDEEVGKHGAIALSTRHLDQLDWRPRGVIVGEPTCLRGITAHNGTVRWKIRTRGVAAHSADPGRGRSAISMMARVIQRIERDYVPSLSASHPLTGKAQASINLIRGGVQINVIPEHCEVEVDRRVVPGEDGATVVPAVERLLDELRREDPAVDVEQDVPVIDAPLDPAVGPAFAGQVLAVLAEAGHSPEPDGAAYATDASQFVEVGVPAVVLGPGDIAQAHTKDEWLDLAELQKGIDVYGRLMRMSL